MPEDEPAPRPRMQQNLQTIVETAAVLIAQDGVAALTMRGLAKRLGCSTMVLYGRVATKEELLLAIAEQHLRDLALPDTSGMTWRETIVAITLRLHRAFLDDPLLSAILPVQPIDAPTVYRVTEQITAALRNAGLDRPLAVLMFEAIAAYTVGATQRRIQLDNAAATVGTRLRQSRILDLPADQFPVIRELAGEFAALEFTRSFEDGLSILLDGIEQRIQSGMAE